MKKILIGDLDKYANKIETIVWTVYDTYDQVGHKIKAIKDIESKYLISLRGISRESIKALKGTINNLINTEDVFFELLFQLIFDGNQSKEEDES